MYHMAAELPPKYRFEFAAAKELVKISHQSLPIINMLVLQETPINTSYYKTFKKYERILTDIEEEQVLEKKSDKIWVDCDFYLNEGQKKSNTNPEIIKQIFKEKKEFLAKNELDIFYTDVIIIDEVARGAIYHPRTNTTKMFKLSK